ncbi:MAG: hypothetical protein JNK82_38390 [Myxococcaceae bacterium]|nr:hypothetical protein [Myxococcaceae bacterium]
MLTFRVEGDAYERGLQQAKQFGPQALVEARDALANLAVMPKAMPAWLKGPLTSGLVGSLGRLWYGRHAKTLRAYEGGRFHRMLEGLSAGFGAPVRKLYGFAAFELEASRFNYTLGCTSFAFAGEATAFGRPLIAYNHDFPPQFAAFVAVRESVPDEGFPSVAVTYPPMMGTMCGVNAAGLAVSLNHAWVRRLSAQAALPISLLVQDVLDRCADVEEALEVFRATPVPNGSMATLCDAGGGRAVAELTPAGVFVRRTKGPVLHTFNAYQTDGARRLEVPIGAVGAGPIKGMDIHGPNLARQARYDALGVAAQAKWSAAQIDALMADHGGGEPGVNTICRHVDSHAETLISARVDPIERTLVVAHGFACTAKPVVYRVPSAAVGSSRQDVGSRDAPAPAAA